MSFPSPAEDFIEKSLNLHELVVKHPAATFFVRVVGNSLEDASIHTGDILVVDRSLEAFNESIVVAILNGEFAVKKFFKKGGRMYLAANSSSAPIEIKEGSEFQVWGIVTYIIHKT